MGAGFFLFVSQRSELAIRVTCALTGTSGGTVTVQKKEFSQHCSRFSFPVLNFTCSTTFNPQNCLCPVFHIHSCRFVIRVKSLTALLRISVQ